MASIAQFATPAALSRVLPQSSPRKAVLTRSYLQSYLAGPVPSPMSSKIPAKEENILNMMTIERHKQFI